MHCLMLDSSHRYLMTCLMSGGLTYIEFLANGAGLTRLVLLGPGLYQSGLLLDYS
jgi:hypothetical protein